MTVQLSAEQQLKFSKIMFQPEGNEQQIKNLSQEQRQKLKSLYAQKIAYDTANADFKQAPAQSRLLNSSTGGSSGIISWVCCCFLPEENRDKFDITSTIFLKRVFSTLLFFKSDFLSIDGGRPELYGFLWLSITYVIILGLAANLNEYFILPSNYNFSNQLLLKALGICAVFLISQPFIYAAVVKCLQGYISSIEVPILLSQSMMLTGYSILLYFIPTFLCLFPSLYWHVAMLAIGGFLRSVFLWRNYSPKLTDKSFVILIVALIIQALFVLTCMRVLFKNDNGYNFSDGTNKVFNHLSLRHFQV